MTIDTKHGRELLAKATPGEWHATHYEGIGYRVWKEHPSPTPGYATVTITDGQWNEADGDLIVWLRNNCAALLTAAERVEALLARVEDVTGATDALTYEAACVALDGMVDARRERDEARAEIARLKANYLDLADAVCRESLSVEDACRQARETREQVRGLIEDNNTLTLQRDEARAEVEREILAIVRAKEAEYAKHQCFIHEDGDGPPLCDGCGMENAAWEIADAIERWRAKP